MQRVRRSTAVAVLPAPPAGSTPGYFAQPNPQGGVPATVPGYEWYNSVQEELIAPILAAGIALSDTDRTQLLQALRSAGVFQTAPQFDTSTKAATMAALQRALGNFQGIVSTNASTVLTAAQVGSLVIGYGSSSLTFTLPLVSQVGPASVFTLYNITNQPMTVSRSGADVIGLAGSTASSVTVSPGDYAQFAYTGNGTTWELFAGETHLKYASSFGSLLASPGYQKLPSGLILQWGTTSSINGGSSQAVTWPVAFPNALFAAFAVVVGGVATTTPYAGAVTGPTLAGGTVLALTTAAASYIYIAIGK